MYERFTDRARKVMRLIQEAAQELHHDRIGTEHILLGLIREGSGVAANVLRRFGEGLSEEKVLATVQTETVVTVAERPNWFRRLGTLVRPLLWSREGAPRHLPWASQAKHVIEYAFEEAKQLGHNYVGTEHILLGLLREKDSVAATLLLEVASIEEFRKKVLDIIAPKEKR